MRSVRLSLVVAIASFSLLFAACDSNEDPEVLIEDLVVGTGAEAKTGMVVTVHYTGLLEDGTQFETSRDGDNTPLTYQLGYPGIISGWNEGIPGMRVGGKRRLTIPPELGYGSEPQYRNGELVIPANATIIFEVELIQAVPPS